MLCSCICGGPGQFPLLFDPLARWNWASKPQPVLAPGFITPRPQCPLSWPSPSPRWPGPHVAVFIQQVVGQLELVEGDDLLHPLGPLGRRVRVVVDTARRGGVCLPGHQPGRAVEGIPGPRGGRGHDTPGEGLGQGARGARGSPGGRGAAQGASRKQAAGSASREAASPGATIRCTRVPPACSLLSRQPAGAAGRGEPGSGPPGPRAQGGPGSLY